MKNLVWLQWGNSSNLPMTLRKITDINTKYTEDNWESFKHEWEPYAKRDTLCWSLFDIKKNVLTSVDKEIDNAGGRIIRILDGIVKKILKLQHIEIIFLIKYKRRSNWNKSNEAGLLSENDYCKGKNDYGDGGIIYGLYLAPKVKYDIILTSGLREKKTFKGYSNDKIAVEDYNRLASGHDVTKETMGEKF
ncbi:hypothetical protein LOTGIDRAFT_163792 [Lottia gigantea]|uniref:Uncharacterized protein n=1 Tax=Lottia gigantea TaxID=225164 RepID=V4BPY2_LOTGI|nr:hypothetical protein LOTGIDRAFT_163792 [Lottia gigantea]ESO90904.1 hypothetical protein LOTGIDRAFT_163792 [Lottia gigantea]